MSFDFNRAGKLISLAEEEFFTGSFSENTIRSDLQNRKSLDSLSTLGSSGRQTYELSTKRQIYAQELKTWLDCINTVLNAAQANQETKLIDRCEKCKSQINKLLYIVQRF